VFDARATELERLDASDCPPAVAAESYRFMERVNQLFGGIRAVREFVEKEARAKAGGAPLRILDIGSGSCDIPAAVCESAARKGLKLDFTCLELSAEAVALAKKRLEKRPGLPIRVLQEDVFAHTPSELYDCAVSSMCFHHFDDARIIELLRKLKSVVKGRLLINDLERSPLAWLGSLALTLLSSEDVKHDCRLSIRKGFRPGELRELLRRVEGVEAAVESAWLFRVRAIVGFERGGAR